MKKNNFNKIQGLFMVMIMFILFFSLEKVYAVSESDENKRGALSVRAIIPQNQRDMSKTYFDLHVEPGKKQTLEVELINNSTEDILVEVQANDATTNNNGIVEYSKVDKKRDSTLKLGFSDIATTKYEVRVPKNSTEIAKIELKIPEKEFKGEILGGLYIKEKEQDVGTSQDSKGNAVINRFAYTIGVLLLENEEAVKPELKLLKVNAAQSNYRNNISATIQNTQPTIIKNLSIEAKVFRKGAEKPIFVQSSDNLRMAPNSNFDYLIHTTNKKLKSGEYVLKATAKIDEEKWEIEKEFSISSEEAKKYNDTAVDLEEESIGMWIYIVSGVASILILIIIVLICKMKRKEKEMNSKKKKKKKKKRD